MSSLNAEAPRTFQSAYTAAKCGLEGVARVLRMELEGTGIRISVIRPGPTGSEFGSHFGGELAKRLLESWKYWGVMRQLKWMPAESVAKAVVAAVTAPAGASFNLIQVEPENHARSLV
jgi:NADP-dependent 3-hydroxy acid dehydrogenase YdfG